MKSTIFALLALLYLWLGLLLEFSARQLVTSLLVSGCLVVILVLQSYGGKKGNLVGEMTIEELPSGSKVFALNLEVDPEDMETMALITFRVRHSDAPSRE